MSTRFNHTTDARALHIVSEALNRERAKVS
jgi:hypothetical protein